MFYVLYCILIIISVSLIFNIDIALITLLLHFIAELCYSGEFCHKKEHKVPLKYFVFLNIILKN